jgi:acyl carrier protein
MPKQEMSMEKPAIEKRLQEMFLPVFGLTSTDEIPVEAALVTDIGADSLDFVEIIYLIEREFRVVINLEKWSAAEPK